MAHRTPRIRMQILDHDPADDPGAQALTADGLFDARFHVLIIVEGVMTGDRRTFVPGSLDWRELPLPLMATDETTVEHLDAVLIGNIDTIERRGAELHGWGPYLTEPDEEAANLIAMIQRRELRGVSADIDNIEFEVLFPVPEPAPVDQAAPPAETTPEGAPLPDQGDGMDIVFGDPAPAATETLPDGTVVEVVKIEDPYLRVTVGRIMGATVVPFPAFQEAYIEPDVQGEVQLAPALAAAGYQPLIDAWVDGMVIDPHVDPQSVTAAAPALPAREAHPERFTFPDLPPAAWYDVPETPGPMPLTILDSGQVFGHLAVWGECHIGMAGECVEPPRSASNYARFHVGETPLDDGTRIATGRLTFATGHAAGNLGPEQTRAHYDNTGTVAADVVAVDGDYGIWVCGAMRPSLTTAQVREVLASPPSGDWRRFGRDLELVAALCVNVPGFNTPRLALAASAALPEQPWVRVRRENGQVASMVVSHPAPTPSRAVVTASGLPDDVARQVIERIAASIGRDPKSRIAALAARVHRS